MTKNIAVFADGTNNSSAALFRTNVWRLYQALDTQISADGAPQLAYYHDGVGTSSFRPLRRVRMGAKAQRPRLLQIHLP
jgi:uncharacterized protein (DUF2235 family)